MSPARKTHSQPSDAIALAGLVALTLIVQPHLLAADTLISLDSASQYFPWYAFLGKSLAAGHIPGWNPSTFSGTPFAANPLSGWTYLPAMLFFGVLPLATAARAYLIFHPLLAAWSTYAFGRSLGMTRLAAFVAGLAYANSGFLQIQNSCCFAFASVYAWLPLTLLGAEGALRSTRLTTRGAWWGLAALGVSQIAAAWLGQGAYYAGLMVGGYIAFRTLVVPHRSEWTASGTRFGRMLQHELVVVLLGAALAAAGLLPRIEFNALSNLALGYMGGAARVGGLHPEQWTFLARPGMWYVGVSVLALAVSAPFVMRGPLDRPIWYFGVTSVIALILTETFETPLDWLLYHLLPGFANLHPHAPERILTVAYLGPSLLAGATLASIGNKRWRYAVVVVVTLDLALSGALARSDRLHKDPHDGIDALAPVDLATYYQPSGAAEFLQQRVLQSQSRFFGYSPTVDGDPLAYTVRFLDPATADLEVNNRAIPFGLEDVQGYDASHLRRYDAFLGALNGQTQDYHDADVLPSGLRSPLLDLLNARYVIIPARPAPADAAVLEQFPNTVHVDQSVRILENPSALPRAWLVHAAIQVAPEKVLDFIGSAHVDVRQTAVLEDPPPVLQKPHDASLDEAVIMEYAADRLALRTSTSASGLLVLSEVYYPAWRAYVDGHPTRVYVVDGLVRGVQIPAGEHSVELRFESDTLLIGCVVSGLAVVLLTVLAVVANFSPRADQTRIGPEDHVGP